MVNRGSQWIIKFILKVDEKISAEIKNAIDFNDDVCDTLDMVICVAGDAPAVRNPFYYVQGWFEHFQICSF